MKSLFDEMRSRGNVYAAWRHVKKSALSSLNGDIRGDAAAFDHAHEKHIETILKQLREERFSFDKVTGVLKDKAKREKLKKDPRPIAVSSMKNRIVQRAVLQVLQPRRTVDPRDPTSKIVLVHDDRLGRINDVNKSRYGVGGLVSPHGGVERATSFALDAMAKGGKYYYQTDIKSFFTQISVPYVLNFLMKETGEEKFVEFFNRALEVKLENADELGEYARLFPVDDRGVAQGSALSAFAGNVLLYEFDKGLNALEVSAVRYVDDLLIIAPDEATLQSAAEYALSELKNLELDAYPINTPKAASGLCADGISFLGCNIQPGRCVPSSASTSKMSVSIQEALKASLSGMHNHLRSGKPLLPKHTFAATLDFVGKRIYGWRKAFSFSTDLSPFVALDIDIAKRVRKYQYEVSRKMDGLPDAQRARLLGIPPMAN